MKEKKIEQKHYQHTPKDIVHITIENLCFIAQIVLCIVFFNSLNQQWLMYFGWTVLAGALVLGWMACIAFQTKG
jgi:hypothetical protein